MKDYTSKLDIITLLADNHFHSGEQIGQHLGISRAAVNNHIKVIQSWGLDVFRVQGKGYCLANPIELLTCEKVEQYVESNPIELIPIIDSTNQYLMDRIGHIESGTVCLAEYQQLGRGRRGRQWISPFGSNLYLSMYWRLDAGMAAAMGLSLVVGIAIAETLKQFGCDSVKVKWPNDIYINDKKLAGILVEMTGQTGDAAHIVIGMGLNVAMTDSVGQEIDQPWTNIEKEINSPVERNKLAGCLIQALQDILVEYEQLGLAGFKERWNQLDNYTGREVCLIIGNNQVKGVAQGINEQGALMVETDKGLQAFIGGEISLRKGD
ncbi:bifunctional biotin--[acetyl-CoA-carboxylase] ligase/biotin operon repressor BirA [Aliivibrio kagoshimensis]|uniref:bifunctional biotin--[acetyl-CoA-carboxylase] ligase/biotin operon repressor BirA n=1 Tax=Aliivibrio kagoshimensis TaxID=2910230 RepID=UPI003D112BD3